MPHRPLVRARKHEGTNSLDLTIPSSICREFKIVVGDAFEVIGTDTSGKVILTYRRIYKEVSQE